MVVCGPQPVGGEREQLHRGRGGALEVGGEGGPVHGGGLDLFQRGDGGRPGPAAEGGGLADDVARPAQGEQRLVPVLGGGGHLEPAAQDEQDVVGGFAFAQRGGARGVVEPAAEGEQRGAVGVVEPGQEGHAVVEAVTGRGTWSAGRRVGHA